MGSVWSLSVSNRYHHTVCTHSANMERFTPLVLLCLAALVQSIKVDSQPSAKDVTQGKYYNSGYMGSWGWYHHYCMACMMNQCPSWCYSWNNPMMNNVVMPTPSLPNAVQIKSSGKDASRSAHYWPHHEMRHVTGGGWYSPDRDSEWDYDSRDSDWDTDRRGDSFDMDHYDSRAHFDRDHYDRAHFDRDFYDDDYDMMDYHHCWNCNQRNCPHWCYDQDDWDYDGQPGAYDSDYEFCRRWDCQRNECPRWCYEDERIIRHLAQSRIVNVQSAVAEAAAAKPAATAVTAAAAQWWPGWYRHYCMNCMMNQCPSYCYSSYPYTSATTVMMPLKHRRHPLLKIKGQTRDVSKVVDRWHHLSPYEHRGWYPRDDNDYNYGYYHDDYDYDYDYDYDDYNNWDDCQYCSGYHCPGWCFNRMVRNFIQTTEGVATNAGNGNWWYYQRYCMSCTMYGCPDWCRRHWGYYYPWRM